MSKPQGAVERKLGRPLDVDSAETRARLLKAARGVFARDGYARATNKTIATAAGLTAGAIYYYYPSKAHLYVAVLEDVQHGVQQAYEKIAAEHTTLIDRFDALLAYTVDVNKRDQTRASFILGVHAEAQFNPELHRLLKELRQRSTDVTARLVSDAVERGEIAADVDPRALQDLMKVIISGLRKLSAGRGRVERHANAVELLRGVIAGKPILAATE